MTNRPLTSSVTWRAPARRGSVRAASCLVARPGLAAGAQRGFTLRDQGRRRGPRLEERARTAPGRLTSYRALRGRSLGAHLWRKNVVLPLLPEASDTSSRAIRPPLRVHRREGFRLR